MVDACMRSLVARGWLNFRMRAMLVSFASHYLWLDWRKLTADMARLFLDYEPGIHYPQFQMQAGVNATSSPKIYNPTKQALEHAGPNFEFIREWVPELENVPAKFIAEPSQMSLADEIASDCRLGPGGDYPMPIVDAPESAKHAREMMRQVRATEEYKAALAKLREQEGGVGQGIKYRHHNEGKADDPPHRVLLRVQTEAAPLIDPFKYSKWVFRLVEAPTGRASCRCCRQKMVKGYNKVVVRTYQRGKGNIEVSYHASCFIRSLKIEVEEKIEKYFGYLARCEATFCTTTLTN